MMADDAVRAPGPENTEKKQTQDPAFETLTETDTKTGGSENKLELLLDLNLSVTVELGRTAMMIKDILELGRGSIIEFDKLVSEAVDILVNGRKIAEGEVVVVDKHFGIRVTSLVDPAERIKGLRK